MRATRAGSRAVQAAIACAIAFALIAALAVPDPAAARPCDHFASPQGKNRWPGTRKRPYRTVNRLVKRLRRGETGCLRRGTYRENVSIRRGGTRRRPLVLRPASGEAARIIGRFYVARRGRHVTVRDLWLDGRNRHRLPSPTINARDVRFVGNDVTNRNTAICFLLGGDEYGHADRARLERNRVHDCGELPATNFHHGVYVQAAKDVLVRGNWIHDNSDYGVHLYPAAQRTRVIGNVIHANGEGVTFAGEGQDSSNHNVVEWNVITGSRIRFNVESHWPPGTPVGVGNVVRWNCLFDARARAAGILSPALGFVAYGNLVHPAQYANPRRKDFRLRRDSPCRGLVAAGTGPVGPPTRPPG